MNNFDCRWSGIGGDWCYLYNLEIGEGWKKCSNCPERSCDGCTWQIEDKWSYCEECEGE